MSKYVAPYLPSNSSLQLVKGHPVVTRLTPSTRGRRGKIITLFTTSRGSSALGNILKLSEMRDKVLVKMILATLCSLSSVIVRSRSEELGLLTCELSAGVGLVLGLLGCAVVSTSGIAEVVLSSHHQEPKISHKLEPERFPV